MKQQSQRLLLALATSLVVGLICFGLWRIKINSDGLEKLSRSQHQLSERVTGVEVAVHQLSARLSQRNLLENSNVLELARLRNLATSLKAELRKEKVEQVTNALSHDQVDRPIKHQAVDFLKERSKWLEFEGREELTDLLSDAQKSQLLGYALETISQENPGLLEELYRNTGGWAGYAGPFFSYRKANDKLIIEYNTVDNPRPVRRVFGVTLSNGKVEYGASFNGGFGGLSPAGDLVRYDPE